MAKQDSLQNQNIQYDLPKVLVLGPPSVLKLKEYERRFSEKFHLLKPWESHIPLHQFLSTHGGSVQVMFCSVKNPITKEILQKLPELRFIMASSVGVDHIDLHECKSRGVRVANPGSIYSEDVADMAVGLLIDVLRRVTAANRFVKAGLWALKGDYPLAHKLGGKRIGIVGMGSIGLEVAKRLNAFNCIISYTSRTKKPNLHFPYHPDVHELSSNCEILIICCALTNETRHMIDKKIMLNLGKKGIIVNIARGAIVKENELVQCLLKGDIAGAGLDVFEHEPNVPQELFALDNVVMTPHQATLTHETFGNLYELVIKNLQAFFSNQPLMNEVV